MPAYIPESYIEDGKERLKYYKMLSCAFESSRRNSIEMELRDRYGQLPSELLTFMEVLDFKYEMKNIGVYKADIYADRVKVSFMDGQRKVEAETLIKFIQKYTESAKLHPPASLEIQLKDFVGKEDGNAEIICKAKNLLLSLKEK